MIVRLDPARRRSYRHRRLNHVHLAMMRFFNAVSIVLFTAADMSAHPALHRHGMTDAGFRPVLA